MIFNSINYALFFPIVTIIYFIIPQKMKTIWLLLVSYLFYMCWNVKYASLLFAVTLITYFMGIILERKREGGGKKFIIVVTIVVNLSILFVFKYLSFTINNINFVLRNLNFHTFNLDLDLILPVGISFYIFQALGYVIDVYRGKVNAEKNFIIYALFISFFPQLVAGPIERTSNMMEQLKRTNTFDVNKARRGLLLILWGLYLKIVLADNLAPIVTEVYNNYNSYAGIHIVLATMLFAIQIYCDFGGYSYIAIGSAEVLGYRLMDNFKCPYLAKSISGFWKSWHISLTSWFTDYVYIPLGGNRRGLIRKNVNTLVVFGLSGIWHGASWTYVVWGVLNGIFMILDKSIIAIKNKVYKTGEQKKETLSHKFFARVTTFLLVSFTWFFFRAPSLGDAKNMLKIVFTKFGWRYLITNSIYFQMSSSCIVVIMLSLFLLIFVDILKYVGVDIRGHILKQGFLARYILYVILIGMIIFFGNYGGEYEQTQFIYFQF